MGSDRRSSVSYGCKKKAAVLVREPAPALPVGRVLRVVRAEPGPDAGLRALEAGGELDPDEVGACEGREDRQQESICHGHCQRVRFFSTWTV